MKTVCVYHSIDLDGWMSAAIVKHWFISTQVVPGNIVTIEEYNKNKPESPIDFIGYNYGDPIPDLSEYDKVIMCDISFPKEEMRKLFDYTDLIWIDHHVSAIKDNWAIVDEVEGLLDINFAACELTWQYFFPNEPMPEIVRLLGRYDCFGSRGTDEEIKVLEFQYGARTVISNYEEAYQWLKENIDFGIKTASHIHKLGEAIYSYLCSEARQTYKNGFEINLGTRYIGSVDPISNSEDVQVHKFPYKFICINRERFNPINFGIDCHKDGYDGVACFHYANGMWNFSLYNDNGEVDCSIIAKQFGGGGHKGAAGFRIKDINTLII